MFPDAGPTARALLVLEVLQSRPGVTAAQLGERLGVSERAARRSITTLREIGLPIEAERGPYGGYRLGRGLRLPPLMFSATEALGLVMAVLDGPNAAVEMSDPVGQALAKLITALPENVSRPAALMIEHAESATRDDDVVRADPAITSAVVAAVAAQSRLEIEYQTETHQWREQLDPWAIVVRFGKWYLLCHSHRADAVRTYRIDRIREVVDTGLRATVPDHLDALAVFQQSMISGWRYPTRVVFEATIEAVRPFIGVSMGRLTEHPDDPGRSLLVGSTSTPDGYAGEWLASVPFPFTVEGGPELREAMTALVSRLAASVVPVLHPATDGST